VPLVTRPSSSHLYHPGPGLIDTCRHFIFHHSRHFTVLAESKFSKCDWLQQSRTRTWRTLPVNGYTNTLILSIALRPQNRVQSLCIYETRCHIYSPRGPELSRCLTSCSNLNHTAGIHNIVLESAQSRIHNRKRSTIHLNCCRSRGTTVVLDRTIVCECHL
jgi:hypothetical protein